MQKKRVLHLTTHLNVGGITTYLLDLLSGLKSQGLNPSIASSGGALSDAFEQAGISQYRIPLNTKSLLSPKLLRCWQMLKKRHEKEAQWDLIHAHTRVSQALAYMLSRSLHIPYVTTIHGEYRNHLGRRLFPCLGDKTIAISSSVHDTLKKTYPAFESQITTILHGINTDRFQPNQISESERDHFRKRFGLKTLPTLGIVSRLAPEKGHDKLLQVMSHLIHTCSEKIQLLIVGDGKEKEAIRTRIRELKLENFVYLIPTQKDPRTALSCIDLYVTYHVGSEGFGLSILEAIAMGKPVVVSYITGGIGDFIQHGVHGYLMQSGSLEDMAHYIQKLIHTPSIRQQMVQACLTSVQGRFSNQRMAQDTANLYKSVSPNA